MDPSIWRTKSSISRTRRCEFWRKCPKRSNARRITTALPTQSSSNRVPGVYLGWANPMFLAFFSFRAISNLRNFNVAFNSTPTAARGPILPRGRERHRSVKLEGPSASRRTPALSISYLKSVLESANRSVGLQSCVATAKKDRVLPRRRCILRCRSIRLGTARGPFAHPDAVDILGYLSTLLPLQEKSAAY